MYKFRVVDMTTNEELGEVELENPEKGDIVLDSFAIQLTTMGGIGPNNETILPTLLVKSTN